MGWNVEVAIAIPADAPEVPAKDLLKAAQLGADRFGIRSSLTVKPLAEWDGTGELLGVGGHFRVRITIPRGAFEVPAEDLDELLERPLHSSWLHRAVGVEPWALVGVGGDDKSPRHCERTTSCITCCCSDPIEA